MAHHASHDTLRRELILVFLTGVAASWATILWRNPLGLHQAEEYLELAKTLRATGEFSSLLRPPGYAAFLALVATPWAGILAGAQTGIFLVQGVVHGLTAALIREETGERTTGRVALVIALLFALNPVALIGTGHLHYDTLHGFLLVLTAAALRRAWAPTGRPRDALLAGVVAGALTLVRPMTLPLPLILLATLGLLARQSFRRWMPLLGWVALGLAGALLPHSLHQTRQAGRFVLINEQAGAGFWPMTATELSPDSASFGWVKLWHREIEPLLRQQAPELLQAGDPFLTRTLATNDFLLAQAVESFRTHPWRYPKNVLRNAWFFLSGNQHRVIEHFRFYQPHDGPDLSLVRKYLVVAAEFALLVAGFGCLTYALGQRNQHCMPTAALFLCLWAVHSTVYLDYRYLYARTPLLILLIGQVMTGHENFVSGRFARPAHLVVGSLVILTLAAFIAAFV